MSCAELVRVTGRLVERLSEVNPAWYGARTVAAGELTTRAGVLRALTVTLAEIGRDAGSGAPPGVLPNSVGVHALADQIRVLSADLATAPRLTPGLEARAVAALRSSYDALWV